MKWFKMNGVEYNVKIFEPIESFNILNTDAAGRTMDDGAPMYLSPIGTFFNYTMIVGKKKGFEQDFENLWELVSTPRFESIRFVFPRGNKIWQTPDDEGNITEGFDAYVSSGERKIRKIVEGEDGNLKSVEYDSFSINLVASKAQVLPKND